MKKLVCSLWLFLISLAGVDAQLCTGSLGDPLVNITFGANAPGPLKPGITNLSYTNTTCPNDGQYTITNSVSSCFNNSWYSIPNDHTGDMGGQFMLVNASLTPNDFYVDTVSGLCSNTGFEFAAWVTNILRPSACGGAGSQPNLTFQIETTTGIILVKYNTGDISTTSQIKWIQFGTFFTTPIGVNRVVLRITNNAKGGCGNDLALDDITFRPCGPNVYTQLRNQASSLIAICENDPIILPLDASTPNGFIGYNIQWQVSTDSGKIWNDLPGENGTSLIRNPTLVGTYQYRAVVAETVNFSSSGCRFNSSTTTVIVSPLPKKVPLQTLKTCTGSSLVLPVSNVPSYTYLWQGPNNFSSPFNSPTLSNIQFIDSGLYQVQIFATPACSIVDSIQLSVVLGAKAKASANTPICEGASSQLNGSGGISFIWSPSQYLSNAQISNPIAKPIDTTNFQLIVTNTFGCSDTTSVTLAIIKNPQVNAGPNKKLFEGQSVKLEGSVIGQNISFYWLPTTNMINIFLS